MIAFIKEYRDPLRPVELFRMLDRLSEVDLAAMPDKQRQPRKRNRSAADHPRMR